MECLRTFYSKFTRATDPSYSKAFEDSDSFEQSIPLPPYSATPYDSQEEAEAVERLRCFLQLCLAQDYLIPTSDPYTTSLEGWGLKYESWRSLPHNSHWLHQRRRLLETQRYFEHSDNMQPDTEFAKSISRPAKTLGLDEYAVRRRIVSYTCHKEASSVVARLVEQGGWYDLINKFMVDDARMIPILFHGITYKDKWTKTRKPLEQTIRKAHAELRNRYFDRLSSWQDWKISRDALNTFNYHKASGNYKTTRTDLTEMPQPISIQEGDLKRREEISAKMEEWAKLYKFHEEVLDISEDCIYKSGITV